MIDWNNSPFWKTYTPLNDKLTKDGKKAPLLAYTKQENQWSYDECAEYQSVSAILAPDAVLLDADDPANSDLLLKVIQHEKLACLVTEREGGRGIHVNFLDRQGRIAKGGTKVMLACGIVVDIKKGNRNGLQCIRWQGTERRAIHDSAPYQDIPCWLLPVDTVIDFQSMRDGDGRNETLFSYILTLQRSGLTVEEIRQTIRITNDYVLKEPMDDKELETILRDGAFKKQSFFVKDKFRHDLFSEYIMRNYATCIVDGQLCIYRNGIYSPAVDTLERIIIGELPQLKDANIKEVTKRLWRISPMQKQSPATLIAFSNGVYNLETGMLEDFNRNSILLNQIPWKYAPGSYSEIADTTLNKIACHDPEIRAILEEAIGYCFYRRNELRKAFILTGGKHNGKSTYLAMIQNLLGEQNIAALDLKELGDRFKTAELFGKLANIGDDIGDEFIANPAIFKKLVTGDRVSAERKGQDPFEFNNYSKFLFSANNIPRIKDRTGAVLDRLIIIPFNAQFSKDDPDFRPYIKYELQTPEVMQYLILLGLEGLNRIMANNGFTVSSKTRAAGREYEESNNPIIGFIRACEEEDFQIENEPTSKVFKHYQEYCIANNYTAYSSVEFSRQMCYRLRMQTTQKKIAGKKYQIFEKVTD